MTPTDDRDDRDVPIRRRERPAPVRIPGFYELRTRADLKRVQVAVRDVSSIIEPSNEEKDGVRVFVRGIGYFEATEDYATVCRLHAEALAEMDKEDRGF